MTDLRVDAIPESIVSDFLRIASQAGKFWGDMFTIQNAFGLRNIEVRELRAQDIDIERGTLTLRTSKQCRCYITKKSNKLLAEQWYLEAKRWMYGRVDDTQRAAVLAARDLDAVQEFAFIVGMADELERERLSYYKTNAADAIKEASKTAPAGRVVNLSSQPRAFAIVKARIARFGTISGYLFPSVDTGGNRSKGQGFKPVSSEAVRKRVAEFKDKLIQRGAKFKKALDGVRVGLHSLRKSCVQRVAKVKGLLDASIYIGHGGGKGDLGMTQKYLDTSKKGKIETESALADYYVKHGFA